MSRFFLVIRRMIVILTEIGESGKCVHCSGKMVINISNVEKILKGLYAGYEIDKS